MDMQFDSEYDDFHLSDPAEVFCFHEHTVRLLRALYRHAQREAAERTLLADGSHLPVELVDLLSEHTIQAEGLELEKDKCYDPPKEEESRGWALLRKSHICCDRFDNLSSHPEQRSLNTILFARFE